MIVTMKMLQFCNKVSDEVFMAMQLKGKYFVASRGFYGTNSVTYQNVEIDVAKYNNDYTNPITSFDWGNSERGAVLLASAILSTIATPTVSRIYANKYVQHVLINFQSDEWRLEAIEVAQWINAHTNYTINLKEELQEEAKQQEAREKEKRRIAREEAFQKEVQERLSQRNKQKELQNNAIDTLCKELKIKHETLAKILDVPLDTINIWKAENSIPKLALKAIEFYKAGIRFKEKSSKLQIELTHFQETIIENQTQFSLYESELNKYKKFINSLDIPSLYKKYKDL